MRASCSLDASEQDAYAPRTLRERTTEINWNYYIRENKGEGEKEFIVSDLSLLERAFGTTNLDR
ncbi:MAG: hypothetical protein AAF630_03175 [Cyanobacteria bacterium P01_C01_bin.38]